ncbi:MAG: AMP-binding protein [Trueperaceae bacterium]|nr:AMP-binding protein [Trueperaceae bacterium]
MAKRFNISALVDQAAQQNPDKAALIFYDRTKRDYSSYDYRYVYESSNRYASGLLARGFRAGQKLALLSHPDAEFFVFVLGLFKAGLVPVFLDPAVGLRKLKQCIYDAEVDGFVGSSLIKLASYLLGWHQGKKMRHLFPRGRHKGSFPSFKAAGSSLFERAETFETDLALISFTSGSTGTPKGVCFSQQNLRAQLESIQALYSIKASEVDMPTLPVFTFFDLAFGLSSVLPHTNTLRPAKAEPEKLLEAIDRFKVTTMFASPVLAEKLAQHGQKLPGLKRFISAGAPVEAEVLAKLRPLLDDAAKIHIPYGATECLPITSIEGSEIVRQTRFLTEQGAGVCVGRAVANLDLRLMPITDAAVPQWHSDFSLATGKIGEIVVRAEQASQTYSNRPEANALAKMLDTDGTFLHRMGDLGYLDEQGRLWFVGRKAHRLELPQSTLFTLPVERIFKVHPGVKRSALVGVRLGGRLEPVLCVEPTQRLTRVQKRQLLESLRVLAQQNEKTVLVKHFLIKQKFPVDIRHNSKIIREELAIWASKQIMG